MSDAEGKTTRKLRRSRSDRMIAGVCGGIGGYLGVDPPVIRLAFVGLTLLGGAGVVVYVAAIFIVPREPEAGTEGAGA
ncbi:MAG: PspC domain-containing protein [Gaiellaceae bacterium]